MPRLRCLPRGGGPVSDEPEGRDLVHLDMGLRLFSEEPFCPKCGGKHFETRWHQFVILQAEPMHPCEAWMFAELLTGAIGEHLCRVCDRCGYGWPEQTADA